MNDANYTFRPLNSLWIFLFILFSYTSFSQDEIQKIVRLNNLSDSIVYTDMIAAKAAANEALGLSIKLKNDSLVYASRLRRGIADYYLGNLNVCLEDFIKNRDLAKKLNSSKKIIESLNAIANVYKETEKYDLALQSYREALDVYKKIGSDSKSYLVLSNIAMVFNLQHNNDSAIAITNRIIRTMQLNNTKDPHFISGLYGVLMSAYIDLGNADSVKKYGDIAVKFKEELGEKMNYAGYLYNLSSFYISIKDYKKAADYSTKALATNPDNIELMLDLKYQLGNALFELKDYKPSAELFHDCSRLNDSINKIQNIEKLNEMEVKYETGKKEEELKRLGAEKEVADLKARQSRIWLIATSVGILFVVVIVVVLLQQNKKRKEANKLLQHQNEEIIHQKKEITDSINYAKRIQLAILPPDKMVQKLLPNAFVLYKPKDVVSGDFYWVEEKNDKVMFAAVDCTGHGVPGAMMSVVGLNLLNQAVKEKGLTKPSDILQHLDTGVTDTLRQSADTDSIKDGMDLSLCTYDPKTSELQYSGAFNNLWVVRRNISSTHQLRGSGEIFYEEHLLEIKADKFPIGSNVDGIADNYTNHTLQLQKGDCVYLYSDGFADQFGGPKGKKFKYNALKKLLVSFHDLPPQQQREKLLSAFENWRGNLEQVDDILVIGVVI